MPIVSVVIIRMRAASVLITLGLTSAQHQSSCGLWQGSVLLSVNVDSMNYQTVKNCGWIEPTGSNTIYSRV